MYLRTEIINLRPFSVLKFFFFFFCSDSRTLHSRKNNYSFLYAFTYKYNLFLYFLTFNFFYTEEF